MQVTGAGLDRSRYEMPGLVSIEHLDRPQGPELLIYICTENVLSPLYS